MVRAIEAAYAAKRRALEKTYTGKATVTEHRKVKNPETKLTEHVDMVVMEEKSCKLSYERIQAAVQGEAVANTVQTVKLFICPDLVIRPGSKITVTQAGVTTDYTSSGVPAVYPSHQEILLDLFERWA